MKVVLVVDNDPGFVFWLGQGLDQAGYATFPAKTVYDATVLLKELKIAVDLLIVNPALADTPSFIEELRALHHRLKVVVVADNPAGLDQIPDVELRFRKPGRTDESARHDLIVQIEKLLAPFAAN